MADDDMAMVQEQRHRDVAGDVDVGGLGAQHRGILVVAHGDDDVHGEVPEALENGGEHLREPVVEGAHAHVHGRHRWKLAHPGRQRLVADGIGGDRAERMGDVDGFDLGALQDRGADVEVEVPEHAAQRWRRQGPLLPQRGRGLGGDGQLAEVEQRAPAVVHRRDARRRRRDRPGENRRAVNQQVGAPPADRRDQVAQHRRGGDAGSDVGEHEPEALLRGDARPFREPTCHLPGHPGPVEPGRNGRKSGVLGPGMERLGEGEGTVVPRAGQRPGQRQLRVQVAVLGRAREQDSHGDPPGRRSDEPAN